MSPEHGANLRGLGSMVRFGGVRSMAAIVAGTSDGVELGGVADSVGTLESGKLAGLVVVGADPLSDIDALGEPGNIHLVLEEGRDVVDRAAVLPEGALPAPCRGGGIAARSPPSSSSSDAGSRAGLDALAAPSPGPRPGEPHVDDQRDVGGFGEIGCARSRTGRRYEMDGSLPEGAQAPGAGAVGSGGTAEPVAGQGESADGSVRVTLTEQGRVERVEFSPRLLESGADGAAPDLEAIGQHVATATNAALDDLAAKLRSGAGDGFDELEAKLDAVTAGFERALGKVADDLAQAQKRLEES